MASAAPAPPSVAWMCPLRSDSYGGATIADLDGDGRLEVAFGTYFGDGSVHVLRGEDGTEEWHFKPEVDACLDASSKAADVDGDGTLDFVAGNFRGDHAHHPARGDEPAISRGTAICLTGFEGRSRGWTMHRGGLGNTGAPALPARD